MHPTHVMGLGKEATTTCNSGLVVTPVVVDRCSWLVGSQCSVRHTGIKCLQSLLADRFALTAVCGLLWVCALQAASLTAITDAFTMSLDSCWTAPSSASMHCRHMVESSAYLSTCTA